MVLKVVIVKVDGYTLAVPMEVDETALCFLLGYLKW